MDFTMLRFHLKRVLFMALMLVSSFILIVCLLQRRMSRPNYRGVPAVDPELWNVLGPRTTLKHVTTQQPPQIHVRKLESMPTPSLNINWTIQRVEDSFFRYLENKDIRCENDVRLGNWNEGGWNVCLSPPYRMVQPCIVFSFGIGYDWQFDDSISNIYGCRVLAFDPSMQEPDDRRSHLIEFRKIGLGAKTEVNNDGWHMKTLQQHLQDEGYWETPVDYLKIDIEFSEWDVLRQTIADQSLKYVKQLGFELHTPKLFSSTLKEKKQVQTEADEKLDFIHMFETLHKLEILGFKKFNYRKNPFGNYKSNHTKKERSCCYELHYINTGFLSHRDTIVHTKDSKIFY